MSALLCKNPRLDLQNIVDEYVKGYHSDFLVDWNRIENAENGAVYVWVLRPSGTHLSRINHLFLNDVWGRNCCLDYLARKNTKAFFLVKEITDDKTFVCKLYPVKKDELLQTMAKHCYPVEFVTASVNGEEKDRVLYCKYKADISFYLGVWDGLYGPNHKVTFLASDVNQNEIDWILHEQKQKRNRMKIKEYSN